MKGDIVNVKGVCFGLNCAEIINILDVYFYISSEVFQEMKGNKWIISIGDGIWILNHLYRMGFFNV